MDAILGQICRWARAFEPAAGMSGVRLRPDVHLNTEIIFTTPDDTPRTDDLGGT